MLRVLLYTKPCNTQLHEVVGAIKQIKRQTTMFTKEKKIKHQWGMMVKIAVNNTISAKDVNQTCEDPNVSGDA